MSYYICCKKPDPYNKKVRWESQVFSWESQVFSPDCTGKFILAEMGKDNNNWTTSIPIKHCPFCGKDKIEVLREAK